MCFSNHIESDPFIYLLHYNCWYHFFPNDNFTVDRRLDNARSIRQLSPLTHHVRGPHNSFLPSALIHSFFLLPSPILFPLETAQALIRSVYSLGQICGDDGMDAGRRRARLGGRAAAGQRGGAEAGRCGETARRQGAVAAGHRRGGATAGKHGRPAAGRHSGEQRRTRHRPGSRFFLLLFFNFFFPFFFYFYWIWM